MGIYYKNLDAKTRKYMLKEFELDIKQKSIYISPRLNSNGQRLWTELLKKAIIGHDDDWLSNQLIEFNCMKLHEERRLRSGKIIVAKVPDSAPETLAEGEFNRFYARGLCARAIDERIDEVVVYRGKQVQQPRPKSQVMIGRRIDPTALLKDLRKSQGVEQALGIVSEPNSGLTTSLL